MTYEQIISELKNKVYHSIYFLSGEEPYYIDKISDFIEDNVLNETEKEFNQTILYGEETDVQTIISCAKRYPMMANYQVVIVKEAQRIEEIEELQRYVENPLKSTILVICYKYKKTDKRKIFSKKIIENGVLFESIKIYENKIPTWINSYVAEKGHKISAKATAILAEYLGNDLSKIVNEINKIIINIPKDSEITHQLVFDNIGISKDFNIFELQNALGKKDILKANQIINYFGDTPKENPLIKNLIFLYNFFNKILLFHSLNDKSRNNVASALSVNPVFVNDYIIAGKNYSLAKIVKIFFYLREYDLKAKGVDNTTTSVPDRELYKELIYKILH